MVPEISAFPSSYFYQGVRLEQGGDTKRADLALPLPSSQPLPGRLLDGEVVRSRRRCELIPPFLFLNLKSLGLTQIWGQRTWFIGGGSCVCVFFPEQKGLGCVFFSSASVELCCHFFWSVVFCFVSGFNSAYFFTGTKVVKVSICLQPPSLGLKLVDLLKA